MRDLAGARQTAFRLMRLKIMNALCCVYVKALLSKYFGAHLVHFRIASKQHFKQMPSNEKRLNEINDIIAETDHTLHDLHFTKCANLSLHLESLT